MSVMPKLSRFVTERVVGSWLLDFLIPWNALLSQEDIALDNTRKADTIKTAKACILGADRTTLRRILADIASLTEIESERRSSVDARLAAIVGLGSIAATLAMGIVIAQAAGTLKMSAGFARWTVNALAFYLILQLCNAIFWAVRGQARHVFQTATVEDLLSQTAQPDEEVLRKRIVTAVESLQFNQDSVNSKVTAMAVAHRSAMNFAGGLLVLSLIAMLMTPPNDAGNAVLNALKTPFGASQLHQGPMGPRGPPGPVVSKGRVGLRGVRGLQERRSCAEWLQSRGAKLGG